MYGGFKPNYLSKQNLVLFIYFWSTVSLFSSSGNSTLQSSDSRRFKGQELERAQGVSSKVIWGRPKLPNFLTETASQLADKGVPSLAKQNFRLQIASSTTPNLWRSPLRLQRSLSNQILFPQTLIKTFDLLSLKFLSRSLYCLSPLVSIH